MTAMNRIRDFFRSLRDDTKGVTFGEVLVYMGLALAALLAIYPTVSGALSSKAGTVAGQINTN